ncbi:hypothetical protein [Gramella sp. KN1008]|uniref:hypothetical protein n=1 Tax=Gramella sp. KN1008 TaxID=2529298 RepID=UPI00103CED03|nr:hypothetical protein [Gramella sp. KN1008]TBW26963.1 hypothetical protein EZJ28_11630 [Gramella sp. KN1008]
MASEIEEIRKIFWHELGHLCTNIFKTEKYPKYNISLLNISFTNERSRLFKWHGHVDTLPPIPHENLVENLNLLTYSLMGIISGCVFQTVYSVKVLGNADLNYDSCFCHTNNCIGSGDFNSFHAILSQLRKRYPQLRGNRNFSQYSEVDLPNAFLNELAKNNDFIIGMTEIAEKHCSGIYDLYLKQGKDVNLSFNLENGKIEHLIEELRPILVKCKFPEVINKYSDNFLDSLKQGITKPSPITPLK